MKYIAIKKEKNGLFYIDKHFFDRFSDLDLGAYHFQKIGLTDDEFANISTNDFVVDETTGLIYFSSELQEKRLQRERELRELPQLQAEMKAISEDIIQMYCGAYFPDKEQRLEKFRLAHNRYREITGKEPRIYQ